MKQGDVLPIYIHPGARLLKEGDAKLMQRVARTDRGYELWNVEFVDEPGVTYMRPVMPPEEG